jgi:hypothetical protein
MDFVNKTRSHSKVFDLNQTAALSFFVCILFTPERSQACGVSGRAYLAHRKSGRGVPVSAAPAGGMVGARMKEISGTKLLHNGDIYESVSHGSIAAY